MRRVLPLLFLLSLLPALPAGATSCAPTTVTPEDLVAGGLVLDGFPYDHAVVGTVDAVTTQETGDTPGRTFVEVSVVGVFGADLPWTGVVLTMADPGWMAGYPFEVGRSYFIPFVAVGPAEEVNYVQACDPVVEVADAEATAARLAVVAGDAGLPFAYPVATGLSGAFATVLVLGVLGGLAYWTLRMRRQAREGFSGTGSDPPRPPGPLP